uniref:DHC_N1 domain-containing protein n=1 Tax=Caenorhabditis tropicalis TaxID=1561998 RepID=A0A1I7UGE9_9PELO
MLAITEVKHEGECNALLQKIEIEQMKINQKKELSQFAEHIELDQLKACKSLILMSVFRNSYLNVIYLNNSIEDLMEMKLEALKLFNLSIELFSRRKGVMKLLKKCLEDLKRLLENMKSQMLYIQGNGSLVDGFKGIEKIINGSLFAETWIQSFILQIEVI